MPVAGDDAVPDLDDVRAATDPAAVAAVVDVAVGSVVCAPDSAALSLLVLSMMATIPLWLTDTPPRAATTMRPLFGELKRDIPADAPACAGDEDNLVSEPAMRHASV